MKSLLPIFLLLLMQLSYAQQQRFNQVSLEVGYGYTHSVGQYSETFKSSFSGMDYKSIGVRYMFNEEFGVKLEYANDLFEADKGSPIKTEFHRIGAQAYYNLGKTILNFRQRTLDNFGVLAHGGVGFTFSVPWTIKDLPLTEVDANFEKIATVTLGLTPQVKLSDNFSLYADVSSNFNFLSNYNIDGSLYNEDYKYFSTMHFNYSLGLMVYLGKRRHHADWY